MRFPGRHLPLAAVLVGALVLYAAFLWPIPAHFGDAIPFTTRYPGQEQCVPIQPGDHLQLLYHFQLTSHVLRGRIPLFTNPYEFNLGEDSRLVDPYYIPFSLLYSAADTAFGTAASWNLSQLASVLVGSAFLFFLARRWCRRRDDPGAATAAAVAALAASCLPYRWEVLAGGSPTGFGMAWIPGVALGVDILVRDGRARGGLLAGILLLLCYTTDLHCLLFALLLLPFWYVIAWLAREEGSLWPTRREFVRLVRASLPLVFFVLLSAGIAEFLRRMYSTTDAAGGRTIADLFSASPDGILKPRSAAFMSAHVFLGWGLVALIVAPAVAAISAAVKGRRGFIGPQGAATRRAAAILLLFLAIAFAVWLALGARGPMQGLAVRAMRKLVPPFRMVRQPIKVFCLLPTLLAPMLAWILTAFKGEPLSEKGVSAEPTPAARARAAVLPALVLLLAFIPVARSIHAGLCSLPDDPNQAYAAAVEQDPDSARALILPIWPGDSAWSSLYEHEAILSGLRTVNGYSAVKTSDYVDLVFHAFETVTQGDLTDAQLDALASYRVTTIILHENLFPEKVSPCSAGTTLRRFLAHPRLRLLRQDGPVWAFSILPEPRKVSAPADFPVLTCTRFWHFPDGGCVPSSLGSPFLFTLHKTADWMSDDFRWHVFRADGSVESLPKVAENARGDSFLTLTGDVAVRDVFFTKDPFVGTPAESSPVFLPACDLVHAGYSLLAEGEGAPAALSGSVFLPAETPACAAAYGPNLMLPPRESGSYSLLWRGGNLEHAEISFSLDGQFLGARPATEPWTFPAPKDLPVLLRVGLHLQGGAERGDVVVDGLELSYIPAAPAP